MRHISDKQQHYTPTSFIFSFSLKFSCVSTNSVKEKSLLVQEKAPVQITALMKDSSGNCCPSNFLIARIFSISRSFWYKSPLQPACNMHLNECISFISKDCSLLVLLKHICVWVRLCRGSSLCPRGLVMSDSNPQHTDKFLHIRTDTNGKHANLNHTSKGYGWRIGTAEGQHDCAEVKSVKSLLHVHHIMLNSSM